MVKEKVTGEMTGFSSAACSASQPSFGYLPTCKFNSFILFHPVALALCNLASLPINPHILQCSAASQQQGEEKKTRAQGTAKPMVIFLLAAFRLSCVTAAISDLPNMCDQGNKIAIYHLYLTILPTTSEEHGCATAAITRFAFLQASFTCIPYTHTFCFSLTCIHLLGAKKTLQSLCILYSRV